MQLCSIHSDVKSRQTERQRPHQTPEDPKSGPCIPVTRPSASFYVRVRLVLRRRICRDTARTAALRLSKKIEFLTKPQKLEGGDPRSYQCPVIGKSNSGPKYVPFSGSLCLRAAAAPVCDTTEGPNMDQSGDSPPLSCRQHHISSPGAPSPNPLPQHPV